MNQVTATGHSVEDAAASALTQLNATKDQVQIEIVDEGKRGFLGLFGGRKAVVKAILLPDPVEEAEKFLKDVCREMDVPAKVDVLRDGKTVTFQLSGEKIALLIGKRGQTLNSLQYLTQLVANRHSRQYLSVIVDAEEYRSRRHDTLIQLAGRMAEKALRTGKEVALEPMPSNERKIIHTALMNDKRIKTVSSGTEPYRHLVIVPLKKK